MELFNKAASTVSMAAFLISSDLLGALSSVGVSVPYRSEYNGFLCLGADLAAECFVKAIHSGLELLESPTAGFENQRAFKRHLTCSAPFPVYCTWSKSSWVVHLSCNTAH